MESDNRDKYGRFIKGHKPLYRFMIKKLYDNLKPYFFKKGNTIHNTGRTRFKSGERVERRSRICKFCLSEFYTIPSEYKQYCSFECKELHNLLFIYSKIRLCPICKNIFSRKHSTQVYCSQKCQFKSMLNRKQLEEWIEKQRIQVSGDKSWLWKGGKSKEKYGIEFSNKLKDEIRKRDNYTCQECEKEQKNLNYKLIVHHIDYDKRNNNSNNLISLCRNCHTVTNYDRLDWENYFKNKKGDMLEKV